METTLFYCVHPGCSNPARRIIKSPDDRNSHFGNKGHDKL
jgi:hypothetical protein